MIEQFLINLSKTTIEIVPIIVMVVALASIVGWIEKANSPRLQEQRIKEKKNEK
tara:strand:- start:1446 stop:1607 length:162 start_codon:yes stop_codon:yes gene_type:complete